MTVILRIWRQYKHFTVLLTLLPVLIWFKCLEAFLVPKYVVEIPLDLKIPFMPVFVIPYLLWFGFVAFALAYTGIVSKEIFYKLVIFLGGGMSAAYLLYMIFPNEQELRPIITQTDWFSLAVKQIYETDTSTNVCPSVHVINTFAVNAALLHTKPVSKSWPIKTITCVFSMLICLSTVFLKQHSILDGLFGLLIGVVFYVPLFVLKSPEPAWSKVFER